MNKLVKKWVKLAIELFGYDLEGCWCSEENKRKIEKIKKALKKEVGING